MGEQAATAVFQSTFGGGGVEVEFDTVVYRAVAIAAPLLSIKAARSGTLSVYMCLQRCSLPSPQLRGHPTRGSAVHCSGVGQLEGNYFGETVRVPWAFLWVTLQIPDPPNYNPPHPPFPLCTFSLSLSRSLLGQVN